jgi:ACS family hexuronate transporter-like MFS transporter
MVNAGANLGAIMTPLLAPALALAFGWRATFLIMGGLGLVWVLVWWAMISTRKLDRPPTVAATHAPAAVAGGNKVPWRIILRDRRTWAISGAKAMTDQTWWFLLFWMPDLLNRVFGLDMKSFGVPLATIYGAAGLGSVFAGYLAGRVLSSGVEINRARKSMMLVYALLVTPVPLVLMTDNHWIAVVLLSMTLAAHQGFSVNLFGVITDIIPASRVASVTAVSALCGNITGMLVLQLAGVVLDRTGSYAPLLLLAASSYLIGLAWLHLLLPKLKPAEEA